jgi:hypothetical protein
MRAIVAFQRRLLRRSKEYDAAIDLYQSAPPDNRRELVRYGGATSQGGSDEARLLR